MKSIASNLSLLLAAIVLLLSACARRETPADPNSGAPVAVVTASPAAVTDQPLSSPSVQPSAAAAATKSGWWIRINPSVTTAQAITLQVGTGKLQREEWRVWRAGEPAEFDVPEKYLQVPRLYVRGSVTPIGKFASLCMMYKDRGVEHLSFDDDDSETKSQTEVDIKCR
jgi:hypothetical protein